MKLYKFIPAAALLLMASCSEDEMDRINTDHGNPPIDVINGRLMITDAITSTGFTTASGDYSYYASVYNEQIFGTGNNQFKNAVCKCACLCVRAFGGFASLYDHSGNQSGCSSENWT